MKSIEKLLSDVPLPKMFEVRQTFDNSKTEDIPKELFNQLNNPSVSGSVRPGMRIAITCGSRGIDNYALVIKEIVSFCKSKKAEPFIVPAMGSHGGATAEGQKLICESLGVTAEYNGCPVYEICRIAVVKGSEIELEEPLLLDEAKKRMVRLLPGFADVLIVDWMGKNISGGGMDANVTGRSSSAWFRNGNFEAGKVVALNLTDESHGNMHGVGNADIINRRIFDKANLEATYLNSITSTTLKADAVPVMMPNDKLSIQCAIKTSNCEDMNNPLIIRIKNTLDISEILVSEAMINRISGIKGITIIGKPDFWQFDDDGNLF